MESEPKPVAGRGGATHDPSSRAGRSRGSAFPDRSLQNAMVLYRTRTRRVLLFVALVTTIPAFFFATQIARSGTSASRLLGLLAVSAPAIFAWLLGRTRSAKTTSERKFLENVVARVASREAKDASRALDLLERPSEGESIELAQLHAARKLASLPLKKVAEISRSVGTRARLTAGGTGAIGLLLMFGFSLRTCEGISVWTARNGEGGADIRWLENARVEWEPPAYLKAPLSKERASQALESQLRVPAGSVITVRGTAAHQGRTIVLGPLVRRQDDHGARKSQEGTSAGAKGDDKTSERTTEKMALSGAREGDLSNVSFTESGGEISASYVVHESVELAIYVNHGDTKIRDDRVLRIESVPDAPPKVVLLEAPKTYRIPDDFAESDQVPIRYEASDDHGLREVSLVMSCEGRAERKSIAEIDSDRKLDRGGTAIRVTSNKFIRSCQAPIDVHVEARDNDAHAGPKWGKSESFTIVPPPRGAFEAKQIETLRQLRAAFVDKAAMRRGSKKDIDDLTLQVDEALLLFQAQGGPRKKAPLVKTLRKLRKRLQSQKVLTTFAESMEKEALVLDTAVRGFGYGATQRLSKALAPLAEALANDLSEMPEENGLALNRDTRPKDVRVEENLGALRASGDVMMSLGVLGRDIGGAVLAYVPRVERSLVRKNRQTAAIAAVDLAMRLRLAEPSFPASGGGRGSTESGSAQPMPSEGEPQQGEGQGSGESDDEAEAMEDSGIEQLAREHRENMQNASEKEQDLSPEKARELSSELRKLAAELPQNGQEGFLRDASEARHELERAAEHLEQGQSSDAEKRGGAAEDKLRQAQKKGREAAGFSPELKEPVDRLAGTQRKVSEALSKLQQARKEGQGKEGQGKEGQGKEGQGKEGQGKEGQGKEGQGKNGKSDRKEVIARERQIAERARDLANEGDLTERAQKALERAEKSGRAASDALKNGQEEKGRALQNEAQEALDEAVRANNEQPEDQAGKGGAKGSNGKERGGGSTGEVANEKTDIPNGDGRGPAAFRERVLRGLSGAGGVRRGDAVKRYTEGLVK
jgi:hypothetical protein